MSDKHRKDYALQLDKLDDLARYRDEFYLHDEMIYLDGNSLGLMSKRAEHSVHEIMEAWKRYGIEGWTKGEFPWFDLSERLGQWLAPLIGAREREVVVTGSTTVNLHNLVATFYEPTEKRYKILMDELAFPTDIYAVQSQLRLRGMEHQALIKIDSEDGHTITEEAILSQMKEDIALIVLPSVLYRSGQVLPMEKITEEARRKGIVIGFVLSHSIGAIPHQLSDWGVDFAFWCNYKHLNGGPGAVGGLYVNERHFGKTPGLAGWFGSKKEAQFDMSHEFTPASHAGAFQMGTPHILSAAPLIGSLDMFAEVGIERIRKKSLGLTTYLLELIEYYVGDYGFIVRNPLEEKVRGGHIFMEHPDAVRICKALKQQHVIPDFRAPNGIRFAPVALYNRYLDCWNAVQKLKDIMETKQYLAYEKERDIIA